MPDWLGLIVMVGVFASLLYLADVIERSAATCRIRKGNCMRRRL